MSRGGVTQRGWLRRVPVLACVPQPPACSPHAGDKTKTRNTSFLCDCQDFNCKIWKKRSVRAACTPDLCILLFARIPLPFPSHGYFAVAPHAAVPAMIPHSVSPCGGVCCEPACCGAAGKCHGAAVKAPYGGGDGGGAFPCSRAKISPWPYGRAACATSAGLFWGRAHGRALTCAGSLPAIANEG